MAFNKPTDVRVTRVTVLHVFNFGSLWGRYAEFSRRFWLFYWSVLSYNFCFIPYLQKHEEMEEAPKGPKPTQNLKWESKANPSPTHVQFCWALCSATSTFSPRMQFPPCIQKASGANVAWRVNAISRAWMMHRMLAILLPTHFQSLELNPLWPSWGFHARVAHCDTFSLMYFHSLLIFTTLLWSPQPQPPAAARTWCLVSPSGPHWGMPPSSADNYCHLRVAQRDKHLA